MKRAFLCLFFTFCLTAAPAFAAVTLPKVFSDHMVLQRQLPVPVFGRAAPGEEISVTFGENTVMTTAGEDGKWIVRLPEMQASEEGRTLVVQGENTVTFQDVVVGEVWFCSGQSNMEWQFANSFRPTPEDPDEPMIRFLRVGKGVRPFPADDFYAESGTWLTCQDGRFNQCTAVGYYFAKRLRDELGVPVGLIDCAWGGSNIDSWIPPFAYEDIPELEFRLQQTTQQQKQLFEQTKHFIAAMEKWIPENRAAVEAGKPFPDAPRTPDLDVGCGAMFNGMVAPIIPYAIRGLIWYQGESNASDGMAYHFKQMAMTNAWRKLWNQPGDARDFPFYYVQLANFMDANENPAQGEYWNHIRDVQTQSMKIKNAGMAVIIDVGDGKDIHPRNKYDVGRRLAAWALAKDYGKKIEYFGPLYESMTVEGDKIRLTFTHTCGGMIAGVKDGLKAPVPAADGKLKRFSIAGEDRKWHWADAVIDGDAVVVSSPQVPHPVAVRYAWSNNPEGCNLYNREGFPACPFRTDDW